MWGWEGGGVFLYCYQLGVGGGRGRLCSVTLDVLCSAWFYEIKC
jgi:hypothetical protein